MRSLIQLQQVFKTYGAGDLQVEALKSVNLTIHAGDYCAIMGPSGSGKSTMMNIIGCLDRPTQGHYWLDGVEIEKSNAKQLASIRNQKIGFIFQQFHLLPQLTALENVILPMIYAGVPTGERESRAIRALHWVGLAAKLANRPNQLSGGQQQRVAIARAIVNQPKLLLADEPTGALDSHTTREVMDIFQQLNDTGMTIVMVTHEADVARLSQRVVYFRDGAILHDCLSPENLQRETALVL